MPAVRQSQASREPRRAGWPAGTTWCWPLALPSEERTETSPRGSGDWARPSKGPPSWRAVLARVASPRARAPRGARLRPLAQEQARG